MERIRKIEIYNASAVAFALKGVGVPYEFRGQAGSVAPWLDLYVAPSPGIERETVGGLVDLAVNLSAQLPAPHVRLAAQQWWLTMNSDDE